MTGKRTGRGPRKRIGMLVFDGVKLLDFAGPAEVFVEANQFVDDYQMIVLSPGGGQVSTSVGAGLATVPAHSVGDLDTLIVAGSERPPSRFVTPDLVDAIVRLAPHTRRLASVCTGAFALAAAGLLDGRKATTHWRYAADLARGHPSVRVNPDAIYVRDDDVYSSAGVAAGIDLGLALLEEDHGTDVTRKTAQGLLVVLQRSGGQSQFSSGLRGPVPHNHLVRRVTDRIRADPVGDHSVRELAAVANLSPRQLTRLFRDELDTTPAEYVAQTRFEFARDRLHAGWTVTDAAVAAGYSSTEVMRRAFIARIGVSPRKYQQSFGAAERSS